MGSIVFCHIMPLVSCVEISKIR